MQAEDPMQIKMFSDCRDLPSLKMSPDCSPRTEAKTSASSWKKWRGSQNLPLLFLDMSGGVD